MVIKKARRKAEFNYLQEKNKGSKRGEAKINRDAEEEEKRDVLL